ncbi:unnamed protein product [Brassica napus]|uniref:(rape) hypothetical protein n=2 Tax=Brassica napus TaxID=3708 RepID=A0A816M2C8_BRANA|nr:unnamed protein product [Brassica napus]
MALFLVIPFKSSIVLIRVVEAYTALASPIKFPDRGGFFSSVVTVKSPERGGSYRSIAAGFCPLNGPGRVGGRGEEGKESKSSGVAR